MASVTMKIGAFDPARAGYRVDLEEDAKPPITDELLPGAPFVDGPWRVAIDPRVPAGAIDPNDPPRDIVATAMDTAGPDRANQDWLAIGNKLFELLLPPGPLRDRYKTWDGDTRLFLDIEPPELQRIPWELAQSPPPKRKLAKIFSLSRLHTMAAAGVARNSDWPFRVLVLVGCSKADEVKLEVDKEIDLIRRAFVSVGRSVDIHVMSPPLWLDLTRLIEGKGSFDGWKPHWLHFVGHTGTALNGTIGLQIDRSDSDKANWVLSSDDVQSLLGDFNWAPQLVFLNACRTGSDHAGTWTFQRSFIEAGTQCVITMQADVAGSLAGIFAGEFYKHVAADFTVQEAMRRARNLVHDKQQPSELIDWALPALSSNGKANKLFKPRVPPVDAEFDKCKEFLQARVFANCVEARRLLTHWICPARVAAAPQPNNILLLTGEPQTGKSHILKWAMESWVMADARVRYIELDDTQAKDFLAILRIIREGDGPDGKRLLQRRLPTEHFKRFNFTLNNLLTSGQPGAWDAAAHPGPEVRDDDLPIAARGEDRLEPTVCAEFHEALKAVAAEKPLILVFDKFTRLVRPEDFAQLVSHLFTRIANDPASRIKIVLSADLAECQTYGIDKLPSPITYTVPDDIPDDSLVTYAVEMTRFVDEEIVRGVAPYALKLQAKEKGVKAKGVARLAAVARALGPDFISQIGRME